MAKNKTRKKFKTSNSQKDIDKEIFDFFDKLIKREMNGEEDINKYIETTLNMSDLAISYAIFNFAYFEVDIDDYINGIKDLIASYRKDSKFETFRGNLSKSLEEAGLPQSFIEVDDKLSASNDEIFQECLDNICDKLNIN